MQNEQLYKGKYRTKSVRLEGFDYGINGAYFITIRSHHAKHTFSCVINSEVYLTDLGKIVDAEMERTAGMRKYATVTDWIIMPNHIHFVVFIHKESEEPEHLSPRGSYLYFPEGYKNKFGPQRENLASIIGGIKSAVTSKAKQAGISVPVWQRNYYEHIIRNEIELRKIVLYIRKNPFTWEERRRAG